MADNVNINVDDVLATLNIENTENATNVDNVVEEIVNSSNNSVNNSDSSSTAPQEVEQLVSEDSYNSIIGEPEEEKRSKKKKENKNTIPQNIIDLVKANTARFSSASWYEAVQKQSIILAGVGGIGSWTTFLLSRLDPKQMFIYDDDKVEDVNLAGQLFSSQDVGKNKVDCMATFVSSYSIFNKIFCVSNRYIAGDPTSNIMICGFDNMNARKTFFSSWFDHVMNLRESMRRECLFIDGRLNAYEFQVFAICGDDVNGINTYSDNYLFDDAESEGEVCSFKQTTYCASMIASIITNIFVNFVNNLVHDIPFDVPFKTYYNANMMYFKTEH
jgi:molybdopterin/thiamine biosynthesis adenylyltransferase